MKDIKLIEELIIIIKILKQLTSNLLSGILVSRKETSKELENKQGIIIISSIILKILKLDLILKK